MDRGSNRVLALYRKLETQYGPQYGNKVWPRKQRRAGITPASPCWWPAETQYEIVVGALLTQNTSWNNVEKAIANLKAAGKLSPEAILKTRNTKLETLIRPSGFYRQKAERLKLLTKAYSRVLREKRIPTREELLAVKGVGKETADSILLYAYGLPHFVIDAYTRRFCSHHRLFLSKEYDDYKRFFERSLPRDAGLYGEYHALIVRWGKKAKMNL